MSTLQEKLTLKTELDPGLLYYTVSRCTATDCYIMYKMG